MTAAADGAPVKDDAETRGGWSLRRKIALTVVSVLAVSGTWLGYHIWSTYSALDDARANAEDAKAALLEGDTSAAQEHAAEADDRAADAVEHTRSLPWRAAAHLPLIGTSFESVQEMSDVVEDLTHEVLVPAVATGEALAPDKILAPGGKLSLQPLRDSADELARLAEVSRNIAADAEQVGSASVGVVDDARTQLAEQTEGLADMLRNSAIAAKVAPAMLGLDGPRSYFIGFQTNAEGRGTGGLLGGYGIIRAADGTVSVDTLAKNSSIPIEGLQPLDMGPEFSPLWNQYNPTTDFRNSNLSAHFPFAGRIWQSMWQQVSGNRVDGAIATDPIALSYLLGATGPVVLADGEVVSADNVVELTMSSAYIRFATDQEARKQYLQDIASAVVSKVTGNLENKAALLDALGRAVSERRIAVWVDDPELEKLIVGTPLGYIVDDSAGPYANVVVNNYGGNKLDYYLQREISYSAAACDGPRRDSAVTVRLTNTAPVEVETYPDYVAGTPVSHDHGAAPKGTAFPVVTLYAARDATVRKVTIDGKPTFPVQSTERGRPMIVVPTVLPRGGTIEVTFELDEPASAEKPVVPVQPLVDDPTVTVDVPACGP